MTPVEAISRVNETVTVEMLVQRTKCCAGNSPARFFVDRAARITFRRWITAFWLSGASASR